MVYLNAIYNIINVCDFSHEFTDLIIILNWWFTRDSFRYSRTLKRYSDLFIRLFPLTTTEYCFWFWISRIETIRRIQWPREGLTLAYCGTLLPLGSKLFFYRMCRHARWICWHAILNYVIHIYIEMLENCNKIKII